MYKVLDTPDKEVKWGEGSVTPVMTLADEYGGRVQIILDDKCYVCLLKQEDGYAGIIWLFSELVRALRRLPNPDKYGFKYTGISIGEML